MINIKKDFSNEEIIKIVLSLGSDDFRTGANGELVFQTVCHNESGGSYKLYYYPDSARFHCYTGCGDNFNVYELIKRSKGYGFIDARAYINNQLSIKHQKVGFVSEHVLIDDWDVLKKYKRTLGEKKLLENKFTRYPKQLIQYYKHLHPTEWLDEGILPRSLEKYRIRYDLISNKIIIPHYDIDGNLIGIRGRALNAEDITRGKYKPVVLQNKIYSHATSSNLYGLHINKEAIQRIGKIMIFESEKSVIKCDSFYGKNNFTVAVCGGNISKHQFEMILQLKVREIFLAFDKEYENALTPEASQYSKKILSIISKFLPYATTYVIWDSGTKELLDYKDSPCDKGQDKLEQLMRAKIEITTEDI